MPILLVLLLLVTVVPHAYAAEGGQPSAANSIKGDVLYWEGDELVVKEMSGHQVNLRVTPETKIEGVISRLKPGDKIIAKVNSDGHALSITLQIPDSGPPGFVAPGAR